VSETRITIQMPHMGVSVTEGTVIAWHKAVGDAVRADEPVCDIATDKVDTEILAPADGVIARLIAAEGETVSVGDPLAEMAVAAHPAAITSAAATVAETDAALAESAGATGREAREPDAAPALAELAVVAAAATAVHAPADAAPRRFDPVAAAEAVVTRTGLRNGDVACSPLARRIAERNGVDLAGVRGSGLRGRIRKVDVLAALETAAGAPPLIPASGLPRGYDDVPHEIVPTSRQRRLTAEHMIRSRQTAAHMTTEAEVDMSSAGRARETLNATSAAAGAGRVSYLALIARAACVALGEFPNLNATFEMERHIHWGEINLGIAIDTEAGLLVPVIRGCERLTALEIAEAIADLAARARGRRLTPDDMRAGTFTISNPGSLGAASAMAIINQPQVAILGTPAIIRRPVVVADAHGGETIGIRPIMTLALTFDHRAIDGAEATRCVVRIKEFLEASDAAAYG
jgi:2-oxoglutarate dehydrogenase E2 component (dihydrolipoamide succinyltransferase)